MHATAPPGTTRAGHAQGSHRWARLLLALLMTAAFALALTACARGPQSTRMTTEDFDAMAAEMAASLARSEALAERGPDSEPWIVSIDRVLNLSSDVMTQSEQWGIVARLRSSLPVRDVADERNIRFIMPPERAAAMRGEESAEFAEAFADRPQPTHVMTATFRSVTRAHQRGRTELYYCEFEIIDLASGVPVWIDRFEYQREAFGHIWD